MELQISSPLNSVSVGSADGPQVKLRNGSTDRPRYEARDYYVHFRHFVSDISQGSVATHLKCGGCFSDSVIADFLLILIVKEF